MKDNFSQQAETYARYRPTYPESLYNFILKHINNREAAWDCATGNGQTAIQLAKHFKKFMQQTLARHNLIMRLFQKISFTQGNRQKLQISKKTLLTLLLFPRHCIG